MARANRLNRPLDSALVPRLAQPATFMRLPFVDSAEGLDIALFGVPYDLGCTNRNGPRLGPSQIREMSRIIRSVSATGFDPYGVANVADVGDAPCNQIDYKRALQQIEDFVATVTSQGAAPVCVGGDHTVPLPVFRGLKKGGYISDPVAVFHVDAHPDTKESLGDTEINHGTSFAHTVDEGLQDPKRTVQLGLRGTRYHVDEFKGSYDRGMRVITMDEFEELGRKGTLAVIRDVIGQAPCYVTIDVDGIDPICCPGTGSPEPGGIMMRDMQMILRGMRGMNIIGGDVCEVAPPLDPTGMTALNAANLMFDILCLTAETIGRKNGRL
ncbi:MAG: agmatinase [Alphaproteobacteria bacterium]